MMPFLDLLNQPLVRASKRPKIGFENGPAYNDFR
jgi:hypothetical protein